MYPDLHDVELQLREMKLTPRPEPEDIWKDVVLLRSYLNEARGYCFNHGRHQFILVSELKKIAEAFVGPVSDNALRVSMKMQNLQIKISKAAPDQTLAKLPPLERFEERREQWNQHQRGLEQEIIAEVDKMKTEKAIQAKVQQ